MYILYDKINFSANEQLKGLLKKQLITEEDIFSITEETVAKFVSFINSLILIGNSLIFNQLLFLY